jgi:hypothetical protein
VAYISRTLIELFQRKPTLLTILDDLFADGLEIQKKGILVFRKFFKGKGLYLWNSVAEDLRDGLQVSFLAELGDEVVMGWR